jgi:hypothetical protein
MLENQPESEITESIEKIEFLSHLVESQNLYMSHLEQKVFILSEELEILNNELSSVLLLGVSFDEAKVLAKDILKGKKSCFNAVAQLLSVLYGELVKPEELKEKPS